MRSTPTSRPEVRPVAGSAKDISSSDHSVSRDSDPRTREFARALAHEHFGLAGVLVALFAGMALSITIDVFVLVWKGIPPAAAVGRLLIDALFLGLRLDISAA